MKKLILLSVFGFLFSNPVFSSAATIEVKANRYSSTNCAHYSTSLSEIEFRYASKNLQADDNVKVNLSFYDEFNQRSNLNSSSILLKASEPGVFSNKQTFEVDARGSYRFSKVYFTFEIIKSGDGTGYTDDGASFYLAELPQQATCEPGVLQKLEVKVAAP